MKHYEAPPVLTAADNKILDAVWEKENTMRKSMWAEPIPATAEIFMTLKIHRYDVNGKPYLKMWRGKQSKPFANYYFPTAAAREKYVEEHKASEVASAKRKEQNKIDKATGTAKMLETINVGTILHYSWGYDQTNCEFYQVVAKRGRKITLREIADVSVSGSEGSMSDYRKPVRDSFVGEPFDKIIGECGVAMKFGLASPTTDEKKHYCSWYA